jgi:hypothetical protein
MDLNASRVSGFNSKLETRNSKLYFSVAKGTVLQPPARLREVRILSQNPSVNIGDGIAAGHDHGFAQVLGQKVQL